MRRRRGALLLAALLAATPRGATAQEPGINVLSYGFQIILPDSGDTIHAQATVVFRRAAPAPDTLVLDLVGMAVDSAGTRGGPVGGGPDFTRLPVAYDGTKLRVALPAPPAGDADNVVVFYHGVPRDGLIIGTDARGHRAAFGDNWPERARYWLPTVDTPADKAEVLWLVGAPRGWSVVANGQLARAWRSPDGRPWFAWAEHRPIPTYTMVIGATRFTVSRHPPAVVGDDTVPIEVWAYPEDSAYADSVPFRRATAIVETLQRLVGPFPFEKLANVESSTRFGGMENSAAIFYAERPYVDRRMREGVVRHETAHQWFGDAVTERDFHDLWLSEGFASYFDLVVGAALDGDTVLTSGLAAAARNYFASAVTGRPVVDTAVTDPMRLLDDNSYQKGAWVLHMLRGLVGDSAFWRGIRDWYRSYRDSSVTSADFERVMERSAGRPLGWFFDQWLRRPGYPRLAATWAWDGSARRVTLDVVQTQDSAWGLFTLPGLEVEFSRGDRVLARRTVDVGARTAHVTFELPEAPTAVRLDPEGRLLLQAEARRR